MKKKLLGSLTRIADLHQKPYDVEKLDKADWATGDYVEGEIIGPSSELYNVETTTGEMVPVQAGDRFVGAFGHRAATLEGVGSWKDIDDVRMDAMTNAGLFGRFTSVSRYLPKPIALNYAGHVLREGRKINMADFAIQEDYGEFSIPTILLVGTSMSAGKTITGRLVCGLLLELGYKVTAAKLTGAGRYRDILSFKRHGAAEIYDFVDAGLPSTLVSEDKFRQAIRPLLRHIDGGKPNFLVVEAGSSPLEPYNGAAAIDELGKNIRCTILCASDPYAVVGVQQAFDMNPDLVAGPAANTTAGVDLVRKLTGLPAINVLDPAAEKSLRSFLTRQLRI